MAYSVSTHHLEKVKHGTGGGAFTVDAFCAWASIGRSKFYQEVQEGRLRLRKIGRKSVVTVADAEAWLSSLPLANDGGEA